MDTNEGKDARGASRLHAELGATDYPKPNWLKIKELEREIELLRGAMVQKMIERLDCNTCANRGRIDGLSQETHCEHCQWHQRWRTDHYMPNVEGNAPGAAHGGKHE